MVRPLPIMLPLLVLLQSPTLLLPLLRRPPQPPLLRLLLLLSVPLPLLMLKQSLLGVRYLTTLYKVIAATTGTLLISQVAEVVHSQEEPITLACHKKAILHLALPRLPASAISLIKYK